MPDRNQKKILIVDDNESIHEDFRKILERNGRDASFDKMKSMVFSDSDNHSKSQEKPNYILHSAYQGKEAVEIIKKSIAENSPYALSFVDIRMPPGWNGVETVKEIWKVDPNIQVAICTAHADYSWEDLAKELPISDNLLILKKPFDPIEILQIACALTKKWETELQIKRYIESLEEMVNKRTEETRRAMKIAEQANQIKNEFLRNMSHELRTPLNGIVGFAQLLHDRLLDQKECSDAILQSANQLSQMINDMLDVSKLEEGKIEFEPEQVNLADLVNEIVTYHKLPMKEKKLQLEIKIDPSLTNIVADPVKFKQIIFHFLSNAIKFTDKNGRVEIQIFPYNDAKFIIKISDTGIGIRPEDVNKLFATFQPLDTSLSKKFQGTGLGLALVRRIVEAQGGEVGVESEFGKGSSFFAILPRKI